MVNYPQEHLEPESSSFKLTPGEAEAYPCPPGLLLTVSFSNEAFEFAYAPDDDAVLVYQHGRLVGEFPYRGAHHPISFGRAPESDIQIESTKVSWEHAMVFYAPHEEKFYLYDNESTNGTYVSSHLRPAETQKVSAQTAGAVDRIFAPSYEKISPEECVRVLRNTTIRGSGTLDLETIREFGLEPLYFINTPESSEETFTSRPYSLGEGREALIVYVPDNDGFVARSFYRSNSTGMWKYLPNFEFDDYEQMISWFGKGYGKESCSARFEAQKSFTELCNEVPVLQLDEKTSQAILMGCARLRGERNIKATYFRAVDDLGTLMKGNFYQGLRSAGSAEVVTLDQNPPEQIEYYSHGQKPNFSKCIDSFSAHSEIYKGDVTYETYLSHDGSLKYLMCRDVIGRVWFGGVEFAQGKTFNGGLINRDWILSGAHMVPAMSYDSESGGYGNWNFMEGHYVDMFKKYLSKVPVIQEYYRMRGIEMPRMP